MTREEVIDLLDDNAVAFEVVRHTNGVLTLKIEVQDEVAEEEAEVDYE